jgi:glycosyltransferase involved in cell wall biosynthesis
MTARARRVRRLSYVTVAKVPGERAHSVQIAKTCEALARRLDEVELVVSRLGVRSAPTLRGVRLARIASPNFLPLGRWAPGWLMRFLFDVQSIAFARLALVRALLRRRFDVYYTRSPFVALRFSFVFGSRVVLELHVPPAGAWRRALVRLCRAFGCRFVTISAALREKVARELRMGPDEIGVAHDGYDPALFSKRPERAEARRRLGLAGDAFVLGYVGSAETLGAAKGVALIVEAFRAAAVPGAALLLVGVEAKRVAEAPGVRCLGWISPEQAGAVLAACDGAVMSFPDEPAYARAMSPLKLFEYLAAGLPVIAPELPNLREVLDESCALFVPPDDVPALADAMRRLSLNAALRARLATSAADRAPAYTWNARAERLLAFLESRPA